MAVCSAVAPQHHLLSHVDENQQCAVTYCRRWSLIYSYFQSLLTLLPRGERTGFPSINIRVHDRHEYSV